MLYFNGTRRGAAQHAVRSCFSPALERSATVTHRLILPPRTAGAITFGTTHTALPALLLPGAPSSASITTRSLRASCAALGAMQCATRAGLPHTDSVPSLSNIASMGGGDDTEETKQYHRLAGEFFAVRTALCAAVADQRLDTNPALCASLTDDPYTRLDVVAQALEEFPGRSPAALSAHGLHHNSAKSLLRILNALRTLAKETADGGAPYRTMLSRARMLSADLPHTLIDLARRAREANMLDAKSACVKLDATRVNGHRFANTARLDAVYDIFFNLARNAVQHCRTFADVDPTTESTWHARGSLRHEQVNHRGTMRWAFVCEDNGTGMSAETHSTLMAPAVEEIASTNGRGVGWATVKAAAKELGWEYEITSVEGQGSTFTFFPKDGDLIQEK